MSEIQVRSYAQADRAALYRIAADTAFFGAPVEAYLDDRRLFCDAFYAYYTDLEPEHAWVAADGSEVVGFIVGSVDTRLKERRWRREVLPRVWGCLLRGGYRLGRRTRQYALRGLGAVLRGEVPHVDLGVYPAHLHINVDERWRGQGLGRRLIDAYLGQLRALGVPGVHLNTTSLNEAACRLYERAGFRLLDARVTRMWAYHFGQIVENRCYGLKLAPQ